MRYNEIIREDVNLSPRTQERIGNRYRLEIKPSRYVKNGKEAQLHPDDSHHATTYIPRPSKENSVAYYNSKLSDLADLNADEPIIARKYAKPKSHLMTEIPPLDNPNVMYRGMSFEEYQEFLKTGYVESKGDENFEIQKGLTYWATDTRTAEVYANSFTPMKYKPTFTRPCYVIAAKRPEKTVHIKGTGENEIGVPEPVSKDDVVAIWQGNVYNFNPGEFSLKRYYPGTDWESDDENHPHTFGGGSSPSAEIVWERIK